MRILVVGAGPTGLTFALAARRRGLDCRLIDCAPTASRHSKALGVQARSLEVLERLGVADRLLAAAHRVRGAAFHLGRATCELSLAHPHPRFPSLVLLPQWETERILLEAGAVPERKLAFTGLQDGRALLRHDGAETEETVEADWIIGCDGAHSAVRHAVGAGFAGAQYPQHLILADVDAADLDRDRIHVFPEPDLTAAFFPLPDGGWRAVAVLPAGKAGPPEGSLAPFAATPARLHGLRWWNRFQISRRIVQRYRYGRVLLAGDAAHIHSPVGGQGMNLGIQDAFSLAAALAEGEAAIDRWAERRHRLARRVLRATDLGTRLLTAHSPLATRLREGALRLLARPALTLMAERSLAGLRYPAPPP